MFRGANKVSWTGYNISNETGWITTLVHKAAHMWPQDMQDSSRFIHCQVTLLKSLFRKGWRQNVLTALLCAPTKKSVKKRSIVLIQLHKRLEGAMLGTECVKNQVPSLYAEKRAWSTSFHGNFLWWKDSKSFWLRQTCALPHTVKITMNHPLKFSQLKFPHLKKKKMEIIMPSHESRFSWL